jgi:hypothetical protein
MVDIHPTPKGFKIAKSEWDMKNMFHYAKGIRRLQRELKISVSQFPQFGLIGRITAVEEEEQNLSDLDHTQIRNEFENYELQEQDPYRIQGEPYHQKPRGILKTHTS